MTPKRLAVLPAALVLAFLGTAGLAVAGVSLPDTARAPFDAVGLQLPNQSRASDVHAVIDATQPGDRGCAFGQAVAAAASQGRSHAPADACDHAQGGDSSQGEAHSQGAAHSGAAADENQTDESGQPSGVPPTPPDGQQFGQSTAADAHQNAATEGQAFGQGTSQGAQDLTPSAPPAAAGEQGASGESHSTQGLSTAESTPGGSAPPGGSPPGGSHTP